MIVAIVRGRNVNNVDKKSTRPISNIPPEFGNATDVGALLGAKSPAAIHRRLDWLRKNGLRHYRIAGIRHYCLADVKPLIRQIQGEGFLDE